MSQETLAILGVIVTMVSLGILWFFMSPKEMAQLQRSQSDATAQRITALENAHQALALRF
jgi:uncharacterized protein YpmB